MLTLLPFTRFLSELFSSREHAFRAGINLSGMSYAVHQYETTRGVDLVYGRTGDAVSGSGACVARVKQAHGEYVYAAVTYKFPSLSANAVLELVEFANSQLSGKTDAITNSGKEDSEEVGA